MNILLTGGSGFIGRNILESPLAKKYQIFAPSHRELDLADDILVAKFFSNRNFDAVIHTAGKPGHRNAPDYANIFYTDIRMFMNLSQYRKNLGKIIILGSGAIYDQRYAIVKAQEKNYRLQIPLDEHALYRRVAAELIENMENIVELRIFGIFGPYEDYAIRFISNAICKTLFDLPITIKQNRRIDYLYVNDLPAILDYFLSASPRHKAYNVTPDDPIELFSLAEKIKAISGKKDLPIKIAQTGMGLEYSGSNLRLKTEMENFDLTPINEAIKNLYKWYSEHKDSVNKENLLQDK